MLLLHRSAYILTNIRSNHIRINENFDQSTRCLDPTCQIDHATSKHDRFNYSNMVLQNMTIAYTLILYMPPKNQYVEGKIFKKCNRIIHT